MGILVPFVSETGSSPRVFGRLASPESVKRMPWSCALQAWNSSLVDASTNVGHGRVAEAQRRAPGFSRRNWALQQELESLLEYDTFDLDSEEANLLRRLKADRPKPTEKIRKSKKDRQVAQQKRVTAKEKRTKHRKSLPMHELRALVRYFRSKNDDFSDWIIGFIILASRLGCCCGISRLCCAVRRTLR
jgi:hypothetical protein